MQVDVQSVAGDEKCPLYKCVYRQAEVQNIFAAVSQLCVVTNYYCDDITRHFFFCVESILGSF